MTNKIIALILLITVSSIPAFAEKTEKLPDSIKTPAPAEQPSIDNNNIDSPDELRNLPLAETPQGWTNSVKEALGRARAENKYVMALFTGSDWCEYCTLLEKEVFSTPAFKEWSEGNVIKLYLDFPRSHRLPDNITAQNVSIFQKLGVQGFPTVVFFTPQGLPLTTIGYLPGGGKNWVKQVEMLLPKTLITEDSLPTAMNESKEKKIPLLLGIYNGESNNAAVEKENIDLSFTSPELSLPSGKEIVLAKIDYSKLTNNEKALLKNIKSNENYPKYILINSDKEALYSNEQPKIKPSELVKKISSFITKPPYDGKWIQDYSEGLKLARLYNKPLLLFFTGSDWCGYCKEMQKNIFQTEEFAEKSKDYILVELDFPRSFRLPEDIQLQNEVIMNAMNIQGFPTVVVESSNGMPIGGVGYNNQSVNEFFDTIEESLNNS